MDEPFFGDEPYSYASVLADLLAGLRNIETPEYDPDILSEEGEPDAALEILGVIRDTLTHEVAIDETDEAIVYQYPSAPHAFGTDMSRIAKQVDARIEYNPSGRVWVETNYGDTPDPEYKTLYWQGWLEDYDEFEAYKMGALAAISLLGEYTESGLSAAQALDLGATTGVGYRDTFGWANRRGVDYEAIRKNAGKGRDTLRDEGWEVRVINRDVRVARCGDCGRNMQTAHSCDRDRAGILIDSEGETYERLPFGNEDALTLEMMEEEGVDEEQIESYREVTQRNPIEDGDRCHDCNVVTGGLHHSNCDKEVCPKCQTQLLSCECDWQAKGRAVSQQ